MASSMPRFITSTEHNRAGFNGHAKAEQNYKQDEEKQVKTIWYMKQKSDMGVCDGKRQIK